ncbi:MAG TPA: ATP-binding protein, partial [Spirochaetota bacterium]|nr:ATP-binding protein [Spirochaetota bacterium]
MKERILLSWSGGKDSALALRSLFTDKQFDIISLLTTVTDEYDRVSMHGLSRSLLEAQAASLGIPVDIIRIPARASNAMYGRAMGEAMERWR